MNAMSRAQALHALDLPQFGPPGDIRAAWRKKVFDCHPDRAPGREDDLARANAAYAILRDEPLRTRPVSVKRDPCVANPNGLRRPALRTRVETLADDELAACQAALGEAAGGGDHVPCKVIRKGRSLVYEVPTPLVPGTNRVAIPTGERVARRPVVRVVTFATGNSGAGSFEVPASTRDGLFPGTRALSVQFARAG